MELLEVYYTSLVIGWGRCGGFDGYFYCTKLFPTNLYKCGIIKEIKILGGKQNG